MQSTNGLPANEATKGGVSGLAFEIRKAVAGDFAFVLSTWLRNYFNSSAFCKHIKPGIFFKSHHTLIEAYLSRPGSFVTVAVNKTDTNQIYGWAAYEVREGHLILHYVYVKPIFRRLGVGKALLPQRTEDALAVTHLTYSAANKLPKHWSYVPYLIS